MKGDFFPRHPLQRHIYSHWPRFVLSFTMVTWIILMALDPTPSIVAFEFAHDQTSALGMMDTWGESGKSRARWSIYLDFLFLLAYSSLMSIFCLRAATRFRSGSFWAIVGTLIAWAQLDAALFDGVENVMMLLTLNGSSNELFPTIAYWCAVLKFLIIGVGLVYIVGSLRRR